MALREVVFLRRWPLVDTGMYFSYDVMTFSCHCVL